MSKDAMLFPNCTQVSFLSIFIIIYCSYYRRITLFLLFIVVIRYVCRFYYYLLFLLCGRECSRRAKSENPIKNNGL